MEFDKDKSFGYPVLRPIFSGEDPSMMDYVRASFEPSIHARINPRSPNELVIEYEFDFSVPELKALIEREEAGLYIDVHCKKTFWSKLHETGYTGEITVNLENLRDEVAIYSFILSKTSVRLNSRKLNPDYLGMDILVGPSKVLAWCPPRIYSVAKEQFRSVRSIIDYRPTADMPFGEFSIDTDGDYVALHINDKFHASCRAAEANKQNLTALMSGLFTHVVSELVRQMITDPVGTEEKRWASVLRQKCDSHGIVLNEATFVPSVVERIMERPLANLARTHFGE